MENRIKEIRTEKGMTLQQVADKAGTTKAQVMKLEKGDRRLTDVWMVRLSLAMTCDPKELLGTNRDSRHLPDEEINPGKKGDHIDHIDHDPIDPRNTGDDNQLTEMNTPLESLSSHDDGAETAWEKYKDKIANSSELREETPQKAHKTTAKNKTNKDKTPNITAPASGCDPVAEIAVRGGMGGGGEAGVTYSDDGNGGMAIADDVKGNWFLPSDYLRSELSVSPKAARIIEVQGDSMTPTLVSGDRVMIDTNDQRPSPPGIFALWDGFGVVVKRIELIPNSDPAMLRISSDNANHNEYQRTIDEVNIIGRVIWYGRRV